VNPFPDPVLLRKSDDAGNGTRTSGSVAGTTETQRRASSESNHNKTLKFYIHIVIAIGRVSFE
jgi:hypothetical protein